MVADTFVKELESIINVSIGCGVRVTHPPRDPTQPLLESVCHESENWLSSGNYVGIVIFFGLCALTHLIKNHP